MHFCVLGKQNMRLTTGGVGIFVSLGSNIFVLQGRPNHVLRPCGATYALYNEDPGNVVVFGNNTCVLQPGPYAF